MMRNGTVPEAINGTKATGNEDGAGTVSPASTEEFRKETRLVQRSSLDIPHRGQGVEQIQGVVQAPIISTKRLKSKDYLVLSHQR